MSSMSNHSAIPIFFFLNFEKFNLIILRDEPSPTFRTLIVFGAFLSSIF